MRRSLLIPLALLLVVGLAAGGYFAFRHFRKPTIEATPLPESKPSERQKREVPAITFTDVTESSGVRFTHYNGYSGLKLLPETMGGGVAVLDYDGDGKQDILFVGGDVAASRISDPPAGRAHPRAVPQPRQLEI